MGIQSWESSPLSPGTATGSTAGPGGPTALGSDHRDASSLSMDDGEEGDMDSSDLLVNGSMSAGGLSGGSTGGGSIKDSPTPDRESLRIDEEEDHKSRAGKGIFLSLFI